jgi:Uma2 family endonuclease
MRAANEARRMTETELAGLPDDGYKYELAEGFLLSEPPPAPRHGRLQARLTYLLQAHLDRVRLGSTYTETGFVLSRDPDTVRCPDVAFVAQARIDAHLDDLRCFEGAPDLAVEILAPSNRQAEIHAKVADYLAAGARLVWIVDPGTRSVTTYRNLLAPRMKREQDALSGEDVLPGFEIAVGAIFEDGPAIG